MSDKQKEKIIFNLKNQYDEDIDVAFGLDKSITVEKGEIYFSDLYFINKIALKISDFMDACKKNKEDVGKFSKDLASINDSLDEDFKNIDAFNVDEYLKIKVNDNYVVFGYVKDFNSAGMPSPFRTITLRNSKKTIFSEEKLSIILESYFMPDNIYNKLAREKAIYCKAKLTKISLNTLTFSFFNDFDFPSKREELKYLASVDNCIFIDAESNVREREKEEFEKAFGGNFNPLF